MSGYKRPRRRICIIENVSETLLTKVKDEGDNIEVTNGISSALTGYIDLCPKRFEELSGEVTTTLTGLAPVPTNFSLPQHPVYSALGNVFAIDWGTEEYFDTLLASREEFNGFVKGGVIVDESMSSTADRHPARIKVWRNYSLQTYIDSANTRPKMEKELIDSGYILLEPSDLFTNTLCRIRMTYTSQPTAIIEIRSYYPSIPKYSFFLHPKN